MAVDGDTIVAGAWGDTDSGDCCGSGSAYVYTPDGLGGYIENRLAASDRSGGSFFGYSVAMSGNTIVVGAIGDSVHGADSGSAYAYTPDGRAEERRAGHAASSRWSPYP